MATKTKQRQDTSNSQVTEEGLLIYAADQPMVEAVSGDCPLFVHMVQEGFSFPGFEKLQKPAPQKSKTYSELADEFMAQVKKEKKENNQVIHDNNQFFGAVRYLIFALFTGYLSTVYMTSGAPFVVIMTVIAVWIFCLRAFFIAMTDREAYVPIRAFWYRWIKTKKQSIPERDPVTEKELLDYLMDVFSSQKDGRTITELKEHKIELEAKRKQIEKRKEGPEKPLSENVREAYAEQIQAVINNAEEKLSEIQDVQNRIDKFIREVKEKTEKWIDEFFPHYEDNQYCAEWVQESMEILSTTDDAIEKAEVKLIKAEQQFLDRTNVLSKLLDDANRYRMNLAEVQANNYEDLKKLQAS